MRWIIQIHTLESLRCKFLVLYIFRNAFLLTSPVVLLYLLAYFWIIKIPPESEELTRNDPDIQQEKEGLLENNEKDENGQLDEISGILFKFSDYYEKNIVRFLWKDLNLLTNCNSINFDYSSVKDVSNVCYLLVFQ